MDTELLIQTFPKLYHMAHVDAWPGIQRHGLLSTAALLDLFEVGGKARFAIESTRRPENILIEHPVHGRAVIRDNKPMDDNGLRRALTGVTPQEWYELLNKKVFFWLSEERLTTLLSARAYRATQHCVLCIDTRKLVQNHAARIWLCAMNSGATKPIPHPRGPNIFLRVPDYPFDAWRRKRGSARKAIAELCVDYSVPNAYEIVDSVVIRGADGIVRTAR